MASSYALSAWLFTRFLALIYLIAFLSLLVQARGLWGSQGVLPVKDYLGTVRQAVEQPARVLRFPTLFWLSGSDQALTGAAICGAVFATAALVGWAPGWMLLLCYVFYLSYMTAGQEFLSFQWDSLLLEAGLLALLVSPWNPLVWRPFAAPEPHWAARGLFYLLLFKLMFLSGAAKLLSGDRVWRDLSALTYHYWTQPLPTPLAPFANALPTSLHRLSAALMFAIELGCPFLIFWPRTRLLAAAGFSALSVLILLTGNYTFFNYLTLALCLWLVPDSWWRPLLDRLHLPVEVAGASPALASWPFTAVMFGVAAPLAGLSLFWCARAFLPPTADRALTPVLQALQPFHVSSPYGLFATMTTTRPEIVIEGSDDGREWREYEFKYKPGGLYRRPPWIAPFQPRLDWQMWFAALGSFRQSPWLQNLLLRLFEGSPDVLGFFTWNPFPDAPPRLLRLRLYQYEFARPAQILSSGQWWTRRLVGDYSPTFERP